MTDHALEARYRLYVERAAARVHADAIKRGKSRCDRHRDDPRALDACFEKSQVIDGLLIERAGWDDFLRREHTNAKRRTTRKPKGNNT